MRRPFPGMDPYLQNHRLDVRAALIAEGRRILNRSLPPGLLARVEERLAVQTDGERPGYLGPDVFVFEPAGSAAPSSDTITIDAPYRLMLDPGPTIERSVKVLNSDGR